VDGDAQERQVLLDSRARNGLSPRYKWRCVVTAAAHDRPQLVLLLVAVVVLLPPPLLLRRRLLLASSCLLMLLALLHLLRTRFVVVVVVVVVGRVGMLASVLVVWVVWLVVLVVTIVVVVLWLIVELTLVVVEVNAGVLIVHVILHIEQNSRCLRLRLQPPLFLLLLLPLLLLGLLMLLLLLLLPMLISIICSTCSTCGTCSVARRPWSKALRHRSHHGHASAGRRQGNYQCRVVEVHTIITSTCLPLSQRCRCRRVPVPAAGGRVSLALAGWWAVPPAVPQRRVRAEWRATDRRRLLNGGRRVQVSVEVLGGRHTCITSTTSTTTVLLLPPVALA
jgi:hypothetical protein